jgi:oxygen-independent coproporphyrinogen III oxidase
MAGLYLHIPFCEKKCLYCDFYSLESLNGLDRFIESLKEEASRYAGLAAGQEFSTIFFGGGTPSLLDPRVVGDLLEHLHGTFRVSDGAEITLETNPGTVDYRKLTSFRDAGINRLSIGVQSFHPAELEFLSRIHNVHDAEECMRWAEAIFQNYSIDLIFALPGQSPESWEKTLSRAIASGVPHISAYSLIVEEKTPLARLVASGQITPLPSDRDAAMYEQTMALLAAAGYEHYEISNYARDGYRSRHNSGYWDHSPYLGFGPSSHSFWEGKRWWNVANLPTYNAMVASGKDPVAGAEQLTASQVLDEAIMLALRTGGIEYGSFGAKYGVDVAGRIRKSANRAVESGLAVQDERSLRLTNSGFLFCDEISAEILAGVDRNPTLRI